MPGLNAGVLLAKTTDVTLAGQTSLFGDIPVSDYKTVFASVWCNAITGTSIQYFLDFKDEFGNWTQIQQISGVIAAVSTVTSPNFAQFTFLPRIVRVRSVATALTALNANVCVWAKYQ